MRTFSLTIALIMAVLAPAAAGTGMYDMEGIEMSRAGIPLRSSVRHITYIGFDAKGGRQVMTLDQDRAACDNAEAVLRDAVSLFRQDKLTDEALERSVRKAGMAPICVMHVADSEYPEVWYPVVLSKHDDYVIGLDGKAYVPWKMVDHKTTMFDTIALDPWSTFGIAPAGEIKPEVTGSIAPAAPSTYGQFSGLVTTRTVVAPAPTVSALPETTVRVPTARPLG